MYSRRKVLGGLLTIGCIPRCACARAGHFSCLISDDHLAATLGGDPLTFNFDINRDAYENGSGNKDFDRALAVTLTKLSDSFGILPGFAFFHEGSEGANAFASRSRRLGRADGSVVFGKILLNLLMRSRDNPELRVAAVCAHEFAHIMQFKLNLHDRLVGADRHVKRAELHADFMTGYFAGIRKKERPDFPAAVFALTQFTYGDTNYNEPDHHGTPDERGQAVVGGFQASHRDGKGLGDAIEEGIRFVSKI
jgi:hypothetical protein